jgi:hypothetical protein
MARSYDVFRVGVKSLQLILTRHRDGVAASGMCGTGPDNVKG